MRAFEFAAIFCLAIGIVPSFALPSGDAPNPILASGETVPREGTINANILSKRASGQGQYCTGDLTSTDWRKDLNDYKKGRPEEFDEIYSNEKGTNDDPAMPRKNEEGKPSGKTTKS
ncbi:hypothetical protein F5148DRAFT_498098 [Russula earlei]|uniref:Uncharacterized protein n=1 Tax=Russula earlei TaxID=71964 RepID=A0ACC0UH03_9AGAM|nr:hypothetical protein F5148DRAFT_498098 [Russula earlei]